jgi:alkyldihydroxyacetonephosphate synthase
VGLRESLLGLIPDERRVSTSESVLDQHAQDPSYHDARAPEVVVYPESTAEVARVLAWANAEGVAVVPFGAGTSLEGHVIPVRGGVSLDLSRMDLVLDVRAADLQATVQPGVLRSALNVAAGAHGLWFPVDPGADASLGGMAATNASGTTTVRYGGMRSNVLALEVVLADGTVLRPGTRTVKSSAGFDLRSLFVGSEGTLGVITRATLQLAPLPAARRFDAVSFSSVREGIAAIRDGLARGYRPSVVRLYDEVATRLTLTPVVGEELRGASTLLVFEGERAVVDAEARGMLALLGGTGAEILDGQLGERWWQRRYEFYKPPHHPELPAIWGTIEAVATYRRIYDVYLAVKKAVEEPYAREGLTLRVHFSHWYPWGTMMYGRFVVPDGGPDSVALHDRIWDDGVRAILETGGVMNDHHGIGIKLAPYMRAQYGPALDTLRRIKEVLDPNGIMNPGKLDL